MNPTFFYKYSLELHKHLRVPLLQIKSIFELCDVENTRKFRISFCTCNK